MGWFDDLVGGARSTVDQTFGGGATSALRSIGGSGLFGIGGVMAENSMRGADAARDKRIQEQEADIRRQRARDTMAGMKAPTNPYQGGGQALGGQAQSQYMQALNRYNQEMTTQQHLAGNMTDEQLNRSRGINAGEARGIANFMADPDMMATRDRLQDLSKGYNGGEMGAMRQSARGEIAGQRSSYLQNYMGRAARAGIGGSRLAAGAGALDQGFMRQGADAERKMLLDNAQLTRSGTKDLTDFLMRQRFGILASGLGEAGLASADATKQAMLGG